MTVEHAIIDCPHGEWVHEERDGPLVCLECGVPWPGDPDWPPEPRRFAPPNAGYGALEGFVPWGVRVDRMVDELGRVG